MKCAAFFIGLLIPLSALGQGPSFVHESLHHVPLPQVKAFLEDFPIKQTRISSSQGVFLLGQKHIWYEDLKTLKISKINLGESSAIPQSLYLSSDALYVTAFHQQQLEIFRVDLDQGQILHVQVDDCLPSSQAFFINHDDLGLICKTKVVIFASAAKKAHSLNIPIDSMLPQLLEPYWEDGKIFGLLKNRFYEFCCVTSESLQQKEILQLKHVIKGLQRDQERVYLYTPYSVIALKDGKVLQIIPSALKRHIVSMSLTDTEHAYLFDDHVLEIYHLLTQKNVSIVLPFSPESHIESFSYKDAIIALLVDGTPHIYQRTSLK